MSSWRPLTRIDSKISSPSPRRTLLVLEKDIAENRSETDFFFHFFFYPSMIHFFLVWVEHLLRNIWLFMEMCSQKKIPAIHISRPQTPRRLLASRKKFYFWTIFCLLFSSDRDLTDSDSGPAQRTSPPPPDTPENTTPEIPSRNFSVKALMDELQLRKNYQNL
jgi:hypothetical protein